MAKHKYYQKFKQYTLVCSDPDGTILKLLSEIRRLTGCDRIHSIEEQEIIKTYEIDLEELQQDVNNLASCEKEQSEEPE